MMALLWAHKVFSESKTLSYYHLCRYLHYYKLASRFLSGKLVDISKSFHYLILLKLSVRAW